MAKRAITYLLSGLVGLAIGGVSAMAMAGLLPTDRRTGGDIELNGWFGDFTMGSADADAYFRARIARHGLLALANTETVYFTRSTDDAGKPLQEDCTYRISGGTLPARWWSVTLYNDENFLPDNTGQALSFDATRAGEGEWSAIIAKSKPEDGSNWISSKAAGDFDLTLRLYVPDDGVLTDPEGMIDAPSIEYLSCWEDKA
ncbi:DUF1214 domain-containing protein [Altererythrobacter sp. ZODW24]|uniref:DUF1214 domain-containing protein n=1 Tax=Altererythrobacter sp. ZODW24 TaxID=2185142 RepID=UPI001F07E998|nr:DUF1214 domain-containing protein [Altererythrobacter sp. ZODW24]